MTAVRLAATVVQLKAERDRARGIAVALEQRLARVEALESYWADLAATAISPDGREWLTAAHSSLAAALDADQ